MSDFVFLHQEKINFRFLKLLKPLTFRDIILNIYRKKKKKVIIYIPEKYIRCNVNLYG